MMKKTTLALIGALAATSIASPVFAQSYDPGEGTGNVLTFAYGTDAIKQRLPAVPPAGLTVGSEHVAAQNGSTNVVAGIRDRHLYDFVPSGDPVANSNDPALTGGGSAGYNALVLDH